MADKITNFEDYKKRDNAEDIDIQIEDPYNFFNEQEREEYFQERQKELQKESSDDYDEDIDEEEDYEEEEAEEESKTDGGFPIELFIRISSVITGIVILAFLAIVGKVKIYDKYFAKDPDEVQVEAPALPAGYIEKNDTVKVTAKSLNLRTVASSESDSTIVTAVAEGTELTRIAVSEDGKWAFVEYNGERVYASMKYLTTP